MRELLATTDSRELSEWAAFFKIEPWGYDIQNLRAGQVAAAVANFSGKVKKPVDWQAFMPVPAKSKRQQVAESIAKFKSFLGG